MFSEIRSRWALKQARQSIRKKAWQVAVEHAVAAYRLNPRCWEGVDRVLDMLEKSRQWDFASSLLRQAYPRSDPLKEMALRLSFHEEQRAALIGQTPPFKGKGLRVAFFNDTDFRPNIGCRLTSRGMKSAIAEALPDASIISLLFDFSSFRTEPETESNRGGRLRHAFGSNALTEIEKADLVVLQPEGSLDHSVSLSGLKSFFAPITTAAEIGKPSVVVNGTIPRFDGERGAFVRDVLKTASRATARDRHTAAHYGIEFIADAALLHPVAGTDEDRDRDGILITTGARNEKNEDYAIIETGLNTAATLGLRPVLLTRNARRATAFRDRIEGLEGILADTASLVATGEIIDGCKLHVGARYHMTIFSLLYGTPTLLYAEETGKNAWLPELSPQIRLVRQGDDMVAEAKNLIDMPRQPFPERETLMGQYSKLFHGPWSPRTVVAE